MNSVINAYGSAMRLAVGGQKAFVVLYIKNKLIEVSTELINSHNSETWNKIKENVKHNFSDSCDLNSLIQDLQRSPLTSISILQNN